MLLIEIEELRNRPQPEPVTVTVKDQSWIIEKQELIAHYQKLLEERWQQLTEAEQYIQGYTKETTEYIEKL